MKLADCAQGRDNNFNLIRIVAALAVLMSHSFAITLGTPESEPFGDVLGMSLGAIAVDVFFVTSGFLVTSSLLNRQSTIEFIWARSLRIFPALVVMLVLTVTVLGTHFTSLPVLTYFSFADTYIYFAKCATLITGVVYKLPGVFESNPYKDAVNGSLWSMPHEVRMYAILAIVWLTLRIEPRRRTYLFKATVVGLAAIGGVYLLASHFLFPTTSKLPKLFFMFFTGAAFFVLREHIVLSKRFFGIVVVALSLAASNVHTFFVVYILSIAYLLFFLAYVPAGPIRQYNRLGDYSYGIYIYSFPIQQSVVASVPGISILEMALISAAVTLTLAVLSWHCLELRALGLRPLVRASRQHQSTTLLQIEQGESCESNSNLSIAAILFRGNSKWRRVWGRFN